MKYGKLVEIKKKARQYETVVFVSVVAAFVLIFITMGYIFNGVSESLALYIILGVTAVLAVLMIVFSRLEGRQDRMAVDYFVLRIMQVLNEQGFESDKFEIVEQSLYSYRIGFRNQMVDYSKLQSIIDKEVIAMCRIMKMNIRVELI